MRIRRWGETRSRCEVEARRPPSRAQHLGPGALDRHFAGRAQGAHPQSVSSTGPGQIRRLFLPFPQLTRGYVDGPPDALEYGIRISHTVDNLHPNPLLAVVVQHGLRELVVLVHALG